MVLEEHDWWQLPRFFLGTSAGGSAAMILAARFPVQVPTQIVPCEWYDLAREQADPAGRQNSAFHLPETAL